MVTRSFESDKNYILKQVQEQSRQELLKKAVQLATDNYLIVENPLGLLDDLVLNLKNATDIKPEFLSDFYRLSADIYRLNNSNNQLEFIWDGKSQEDKFYEQWTDAFVQIINSFSYHPSFNRIVIRGAVLYPNDNHTILKSTLERLICKEYGIKRTSKGIKKSVKVA